MRFKTIRFIVLFVTILHKSEILFYYNKVTFMNARFDNKVAVIRNTSRTSRGTTDHNNFVVTYLFGVKIKHFKSI